MPGLSRDARKSVALYHLPATGTTEYPAAPDVRFDGDLIPMDRMNSNLEGGSYQDPHELYVYDLSVDIRENDKVVIDSTTYYVKKVFRAPIGRLRHRRCTISTEL